MFASNSAPPAAQPISFAANLTNIQVNQYNIVHYNFNQLNMGFSLPVQPSPNYGWTPEPTYSMSPPPYAEIDEFGASLDAFYQSSDPQALIHLYALVGGASSRMTWLL